MYIINYSKLIITQKISNLLNYFFDIDKKIFFKSNEDMLRIMEIDGSLFSGNLNYDYTKIDDTLEELMSEKPFIIKYHCFTFSIDNNNYWLIYRPSGKSFAFIDKYNEDINSKSYCISKRLSQCETIFETNNFITGFLKKRHYYDISSVYEIKDVNIKYIENHISNPHSDIFMTDIKIKEDKVLLTIIFYSSRFTIDEWSIVNKIKNDILNDSLNTTPFTTEFNKLNNTLNVYGNINER